MAYIIQHRRDYLDNWVKVNPVLADAEMGFILDLDENGKQKSSLYKIGDGKHAWNDLPLFGFGGNVYDSFEGDDLDVTVASRRAILEKLTNIIEGTEEVEGLLNKLSNTQLVQFISPENGEQFGDLVNELENPLTWEQMQPILEKQIVSRWALLVEFQQIWNDFSDLETNYIKVINEDLQTLNDFAKTFGEFKTAAEEDILQIQTDLEECRKYVFGWDEETENPEGGDPIIVHHNGIGEVIDEKIAEVNDSISTLREDVTNKHQIMSQLEFDNTDFANPEVLELFKEGTIFYTYLEEDEN